MKGKHLVPAFLLQIVLIAVVLIAYMNLFNKETYGAMFENMEEISQHDIGSIRSYFDSRWNELEHIGERLSMYQSADEGDIRKQLSIEQASSNFEILYLVDEKGQTYTNNMIYEADETLLNMLNDKDGRFVMKYNDGSYSDGTEKENIIYGARTAPFNFGGVNFIGIMASSDTAAIQDRLKIDSFDGRGYSSIIDRNGYFIVGVDLSYDTNNADNFFERLRNGNSSYKDGAEGIIEKIQSGESLFSTYINQQGEERVFVCQPVEDTDWYFVMSIPISVFVEQSAVLLRMTTVMLIVVVVIIAIMAAVLFKSSRNTIEARAEANARSSFLSIMSHEIRTPLNGIIGLNKLMQDNIGDCKRISEYLSKSADTSQYLLALVNDILDISKLHEGKVELLNEPFSIEEITESVCSMQRDNILSKKIEFTFSKDITVPYVMGDEIRLKQVLMNIVSNAAKFTEQGGRISFTVTQECTGKNTVTTFFEIADTGCGISEDFQKHIFEPFSQERSKILSSQKGTGLGMSISYMLMKQMDGDIELISQEGRGSIFTVVFPSKISDEKLNRVTLEKPPVNFKDKPLSILIAEDNELNAEILTEILSAAGCTVTHANDGKKTVERFLSSESNELDVILMDIQMPVMNGYEAAAEIRSCGREDAKTVKIFACTANTFNEDAEKAYESGMDDFLAKPIDVAELMSKLGR